jgi:hypothetical protein
MQKKIWLLKLLGASLAVLGLITSLDWTANNINLPSAIAQDTTPIPAKQDTKIVGRWIIKSLSGRQTTIIFTPEGKLFEIRQNQAFEVGGYQ